MSYFGSKQYSEDAMRYGAELASLQEMTRDERLQMMLVYDLSTEKLLLQRLMSDYKFLRYEIQKLKVMLQDELLAYNEEPVDSTLDLIEKHTEQINSFTRYRHEIRVDIRETRERVRWLKKKLATMKQQQQP